MKYNKLNTPKGKWQTWTATYTFDEKWQRLKEYWALPWYKRIFRRPPK